MAMSKELLVLVILPWVNCCATVDNFVPIPICAEPVPVSELANTSANSARDCLNPTVLALETLLPITSNCFEAALRPLNPCWKLMLFSCFYSISVL